MGLHNWQPLVSALILATLGLHLISIVFVSGFETTSAERTTDPSALVVASEQLVAPAAINHHHPVGGVNDQQQPRIAGPVVGKKNGAPSSPWINVPPRIDGTLRPTPGGTMARPRTTTNRTTGPLPAQRPPVSNSSMAKMVCFYSSYAATRFGPGRLRVDDIDPSLCTHIIYGSLGLDEKDEIEALNPEIDLKDYDGLDSINKLFKLKQSNPTLKTLISVGGAGVSAEKFSSMAVKSDSRSRFIKSVVKFLIAFRLDGLNIDWQHPGSKGSNRGSLDDKSNFVTLLRELKSALEPKGYLLTAQVAGQKSIIDVGYNIPQVVKYLDFVNLIAYDYHETHDNRTGVLAPIFQFNKYNDARDTVSNIRWSVNHWIHMGAEPQRIMLGIAFYGQTYELDNINQQTGLNAPAVELGEPGSHTSVAGILGYNEICIKFVEDSKEQQSQGRSSNWNIKRDGATQISYAYKQKEWISFDDPTSVARKTDLAMLAGLGGMFLFSLDTDDFSGSCHNIKYPLTKSVKNAIEQAARPQSQPNPQGRTNSRGSAQKNQ